ncbi:MAG: hypothetical protein ABIJ46_02675 [bacterium]
MNQEMESDVCPLCGFPSHAGHGPHDESAEREGLIGRKVEAIMRQSPNLSIEGATNIAKEEVDQGKSVEGSIDIGFGLGQYELEGETREKMEQWKDEVTEILDSLQKGMDSGDFSKFVEATNEKFHQGDVRKIIDKLTRQAEETGVEIDDEAKKLMAIGFWLWREQGGEWKTGRTELQTVARMLSGRSKIGDVLKRETSPNCVETSFLIRAVARKLGVPGEVRKTRRKIVDHRYFQTDNGKVMDYWWLRGTAGVALTKEAYKKLRPDVTEDPDHGHE